MQRLAALKDAADPLARVAAQIAQRYRLVCFDEFHVTDIADAMILGRLLAGLFEHGVVLVMTSNYAPDDLWPHGLLRERFLPAIALIKRMARRRRGRRAASTTGCARSSRSQTFHVPAGAARRRGDGRGVRGDARRSRRGVRSWRSRAGRSTARRRAGSVVWFDFRRAVRRPALAARLSRARPPLRRGLCLRTSRGWAPDTADQARRFTWLDRHPVRSSREARRVRGRARPMRCTRRGPNAREFSAHGQPAHRNAHARLHGASARHRR